jgi:tetratricopeptide (TPR) repeat protein
MGAKMKKRSVLIAFTVFGLWPALAFAAPGKGVEANNNCYDQFRGGNMKAAIDYCTKAINSGELEEPDLVGALINRGVAFRNEGNYKLAIVDYTTALKHAPKDAMIYANRANARRELGELKSAMVDANQAIKLDPTRPASFYSRGAVYEAGNQPKLARKDYMQALTLEPANLDYQNKILTLDAKLATTGEGTVR